jgi:cobalt-zinc-cadmium resistance protein CzcA
MGSEFIPTLEEGDFALHQILPPGSSISQGVEISGPLQDILISKFPEVEKVVTMIGTAEIPTDIMPLEAGDIYVILKPKKEWTTAETKEEMFEAMEIELNKFPGVIYEFTQPIQMQFNELMTGVRQDIAVRIYGEDLGLLVQLARQAESLLQTIEGADDIQVEPTAGLQQMVVDYDRAKMSKYGVSIAHLNDILKSSFAGKIAGKLYEGERQYDIVIRLRDEERQSLESLQSLHVDLEGGGYVPMSELAKITFEEGPTQISRDDTKRRITIGVNARNRDIASLIDDIKLTFSQELNLPAGYHIRYGGQFENLERAKARLGVVVPLALMLIFLLLYFTFSSAKYALLIFTAIPLSAIGGIWALYLRGMPFSISAGVGFIALFGVAVLNGIVLIAYFNRLRREGMTDVHAIVIKGTRVRLRPVIMTASVASLGFLPMALSTSAGAEVQRPLATVVIGGLITATILTLIILPILYCIMDKLSTNISRKVMPALFLILLPWAAGAQEDISLEQALLELESADLDFGRSIQLRLDALEARSSHPVAPTPWSLSLEGEEFNLEGVEGIQSLNIGKTFHPVGLKDAYRSHIRLQKESVENRLQIDLITLKRHFASTYISAAYFRSMFLLEAERRSQYEQFVRIAERKADLGEFSGIPARQARLEIEDIDILVDQIASQLDLYNSLVNHWLGDSVLQVTSLDAVLLTEELAVDLADQPVLKAFEIREREVLAEAKVTRVRNSLQPFVGVTAQGIQGNYLFYGYQVGLQIPLSSGFNRKLQEASSTESLAIRAEGDWKQDLMETRMNQLRDEILIIERRLDKVTVHLLEHEELSEDVRRAYQLGEMSYFEMVLSFQSFYDLRREELDLLKKRLDILNELIHFTN